MVLGPEALVAESAGHLREGRPHDDAEIVDAELGLGSRHDAAVQIDGGFSHAPTLAPWRTGATSSCAGRRRTEAGADEPRAAAGLHPGLQGVPPPGVAREVPARVRAGVASAPAHGHHLGAVRQDQDLRGGPAPDHRPAEGFAQVGGVLRAQRPAVRGRQAVGDDRDIGQFAGGRHADRAVHPRQVPLRPAAFASARIRLAGSPGVPQDHVPVVLPPLMPSGQGVSRIRSPPRLTAHSMKCSVFCACQKSMSAG